MRILVADSDREFLRWIELSLVSEGFNVELSDNGGEAVELARLYEWDAIVLGDTHSATNDDMVLSIRKANVKTPIIVASTVKYTDAVVRSLGRGADDFMTKPFHKDELVARLHALVRRSRGHARSILTAGPLALDLDMQTVTVAGKPVWLSGKPFALLECLMLRKGKVQSKEQILTALYGGMDEPEVKIIDVFICKLRKKIPADLIRTVWGRGYMIHDDTVTRTGTVDTDDLNAHFGQIGLKEGALQSEAIALEHAGKV